MKIKGNVYKGKMKNKKGKLKEDWEESEKKMLSYKEVGDDIESKMMK